MSKIRVLLTDDHTLFRQGIHTLLAEESDIDVAGEAPMAPSRWRRFPPCGRMLC